jgi:hypothetical protein
MNKRSLLFPLLVAGVIILTGCGSKDLEQQKNDDQVAPYNSASASTGQMSTIPAPADKIEVFHFHAAQQCWSCITVGEYALKTIQEKFPQEYANGTIVYKDINAELPENKDIVMKYQARGSSLFVNAVTDGKDQIAEDATVWRLVNNENKFIDYFENKLNVLLGK